MGPTTMERTTREAPPVRAYSVRPSSPLLMYEQDTTPQAENTRMKVPTISASAWCNAKLVSGRERDRKSHLQRPERVGEDNYRVGDGESATKTRESMKEQQERGRGERVRENNKREKEPSVDRKRRERESEPLREMNVKS